MHPPSVMSQPHAREPLLSKLLIVQTEHTFCTVTSSITTTHGCGHMEPLFHNQILCILIFAIPLLQFKVYDCNIVCCQ